MELVFFTRQLGVSALTDRAAVIVKPMPSPEETPKRNPVFIQAATATSREPEGLQTAASCVDKSRVIIKLYTRVQRNKRMAADRDRFSCQQGQLSLLLRSFVSNCPTGGYELPATIRVLRTAQDNVFKQARVNR
jgi:hypothetical protein